jgi:phosphoribosylformylglycinamidine (FGAM) synthase PurS component
MPRSEILDPQGQALARLGVSGVRDVRQGKRFEIEIDGELDGELDETTLARLRDAADGLLANPVIETWTLTVQS